jgi:broad specificity phosphatase PhoE
MPEMKIIEIRRHSIRSKPGEHLNQHGVTLARLVGETLGPFDCVATSTLPRAFETAIAMGFAVDTQIGLMSTYGDDVEHEVPWPQTFADYAKAVLRGGAAAQYAHQLVEFYTDLENSLADNRSALVINHGGILELGTVASFPDADYDSWGRGADFCEGARLFWDDGRCVNAEALRVVKWS